MENRDNEKRRGGDTTVNEVGEQGDDTTSSTHDRRFSKNIGHKDRQRGRELEDKGKEAEEDDA